MYVYIRMHSIHTYTCIVLPVRARLWQPGLCEYNMNI